MLIRLGVSLALTVLIEGAFALLWGLRGRRELGLTVLANCLTNPPVVLLRHTALRLWRWSALPVTAALEIAAAAVEWRCYRAFSRQLRRPLLFSLLANGLSFGVGSVLTLLRIRGIL